MNQKGLLCITVLSLMIITAHGLKVADKKIDSKGTTDKVQTNSTNLNSELDQIKINGKVVEFDPNTSKGKFIKWVKDNVNISSE